MSTLRGFLALCCLALLCLVACVRGERAASQSYTLQRRIGSAGAWDAVARFAVARRSADLPARLRPAPPKAKAKAPSPSPSRSGESGESGELTGAVKRALAEAAVVRYRVVPDGAAEGDAAVSIATSPCAIVRGFDAVDSRTVVLKETIGVAVGPGTTIVGLQASSTTNSFHAKMVDGDECDISILSLFPHVRTQVNVEIVQPAQVLSTPKYEQLDKFGKPKEEEKKQRKTRGKEGEEEGETEDERTFLQKYWVYMVVPIVISFVQNLITK